MSEHEHHKPVHGAFCWNELMTSDVNKAKEFYKALFNWQYDETHMDNNIRYNLITTLDRQNGGMLQIPDDKRGQIPPIE